MSYHTSKLKNTSFKHDIYEYLLFVISKWYGKSFTIIDIYEYLLFVISKWYGKLFTIIGQFGEE